MEEALQKDTKMILTYTVTMKECVDRDINLLTEKETETLVKDIEEAIAKWMEFGGVRLAAPIKIEFDLEEEKEM